MDELGAEAAAATEIEIMAGSCLMPPEEPLKVNVDHPSVVAIVDGEGVPLFLGHLSDPEPLQK